MDADEISEEIGQFLNKAKKSVSKKRSIIKSVASEETNQLLREQKLGEEANKRKVNSSETMIAKNLSKAEVGIMTSAFRVDDDEMSEEFNNFMYRVSEVSNIVQKLSSKDMSLQNIGIVEADKLLNETKSKEVEEMNIEDIKITVKSNKTIINCKDDAKTDGETKTQEAFMKEVSRDADKRYKDKCVRTEKMETFKKQATKAYRRGEYERALSCYNKAIELIRDCPLLYNNRCLTYISLKLYKPAIEDAKTALKLNENCLRSFLLLAKAHLLNGERLEYDKAIKEAKRVSPVDLNFIHDFHEKLTMSVSEDGPEKLETDCNVSGLDSTDGIFVKTIETFDNFEYEISSEESSDSESEEAKESRIKMPQKRSGKTKITTASK